MVVVIAVVVVVFGFLRFVASFRPPTSTWRLTGSVDGCRAADYGVGEDYDNNVETEEEYLNTPLSNWYS